MANISWNSAERDKVRLLAGIESEELDNSKLDILLNMSVDWFEQQTGLTYTLELNNGLRQLCCLLYLLFSIISTEWSRNRLDKPWRCSSII
jgi:hypothetical protein